MSNKILVIGSLNMDMVVRLPELPRVGQTLLGRLGGYVPGGKGANQAYAAGRLGKRVAMLGKVGTDVLGEQLKANLADVGVDVSHVAVQEGATSGLALIYVSDAGDNSIVVLPNANAVCHERFIKEHEALISDSDIVLIQLEIPLPAAFQAIRLAKAHGRTVILNPAPAPDRDAIPGDVLRLLDYITPNETELEALTGVSIDNSQSVEKAARILLAQGINNVVATLGGNGALLCNTDGSHLFEAEKVSVADTTAAGDTFNAALAVGLSEGMDIGKAIGFANRAAAICVTRHGAQTSIPSRDEVDRR